MKQQFGDPRTPSRSLDIFSFLCLIASLAGLALALGGRHGFRSALFRASAKEHLGPILYARGELLRAGDENDLSVNRSRSGHDYKELNFPYDYNPTSSASIFERAFRFQGTGPLRACSGLVDYDPTVARLGTVYPEFFGPVRPALQTFLARDADVINARCTFETSLRQLSSRFLEFVTPLSEPNPLPQSILDAQRKKADQLAQLLARHSKLAGSLLVLVSARTLAASTAQFQLDLEGVDLKLDRSRDFVEPRMFVKPSQWEANEVPPWLLERGAPLSEEMRLLISACQTRAVDPAFLSAQKKESQVEFEKFRSRHQDGSEPGLDTPSLGLFEDKRRRQPWWPVEYVTIKRCTGVDLAQ